MLIESRNRAPPTIRAGEADNRLGVIGGPAAWLQAFNHLMEQEENSVVYFLPSTNKFPEKSALWEWSGRQISCREKVTKFLRPSTVWNSLWLRNTRPQQLPALAKMAYTFVHERLYDEGHDEVIRDINESLNTYRKVNEFLASVGEKPIWKETGRLVIAGEKEYGSLYETVLAWRTKKGLVGPEPLKEKTNGYLAECGLFHSGYRGYPLVGGGYVVRDAESILIGALLKKFGGKKAEGRFKVVDLLVESIASCVGGGYTMRAPAWNEFGGGVSNAHGETAVVGKVFLSPGSAPVVDNERRRLCPPIEITGHSGTILQKLSKDQLKKVLDYAGCDTLEAFFDKHPAAFMTDDYELTLESIEVPGDKKHEVEDTPAAEADAPKLTSSEEPPAATIRWRCTGNAHINSKICTADPEKTLGDPVRRFLAGNVTVEGWAWCRRQVGPTFREQVAPFGKTGKVVLNWGHMGLTLAGRKL